MAEATTIETMRQGHAAVEAAYARAMRAEGKGGFDQMGWRGRWIVWRDLKGAPALARFRTALWKERTFVVSCLAVALTALNLLRR